MAAVAAKELFLNAAIPKERREEESTKSARLAHQV
jgi:hypothetical protein